MNSHYVPQFILNGFCNKNNNLIYCDFDNKTTSLRNTKSVFSEKNYYPERLEKDLCYKIETSFAKLYHNKIENAEQKIQLTSDELFIVQKYLIVSAMRYKYELTENDKLCLDLIPKKMQHLYKIDSVEGLELILQYNNSVELLDYVNNVIATRYSPDFISNTDETETNLQMFIETREILCNYLIFVRPNENEEYIIPDVGRTSFMGKLAMEKLYASLNMTATSLIFGSPDFISMNLPKTLSPRDFMLYPLSRNLAIISMSPFYRLVSELAKRGELKNLYDYSEALGFSDNTIINSRPWEKDGLINFRVRYINNHDMCHLNCSSINQSKHFAACSDLSKIQKSLAFAKNIINRDVSFLLIE